MLHKINLNTDTAVGFRWEGKYDEQALKHSLTEFLPERELRTKVNVYVEVLELNDVEGKALWEGLKFDVKNFKQLTEKIDRVALVSDLEWLKTLAKASYSLVPGMQSRTFGLDEKHAARQWVMQ